MQRNLFSNRQLRVFNALLLNELRDDHCYINARKKILGRDTAAEWVEFDLTDGTNFVFSYAEDKPWFHRCGVIPIYCGVKGSLEEGRDFRDEILRLIRDWGYEAAVGDLPSMNFRINVNFPFPRWHEEDHDDDLLDASEITLFAELEEMKPPFSLGMTNDSWFNESADTFFKESMTENRQKGSIYYYLHDQYERWERSLPNVHKGRTGCVISHYDSNARLQAQSDFLPIGTFSKETNTFLWSWMNRGWLECYQLDDKLREKNPGLHEMLHKIYSIAHEHGYKEFANEETFETEEFECWEFAAMACKQLNADASFALPGEHGTTYGILFYQNENHRDLTQQTIRLLSEWRAIMKAFLHSNKSLYDASSLSFAKSFLQSNNATQIEKSFKEAIENEQLLNLVSLRLGVEANEERRFKETLKALLAKLNKGTYI